MLTAIARPALPGLPRQPPAAPARRQDSSGSSGSYHTAPASPEPPDVGPDAEDQENWPWVAPRLGAGVQPRLSVSAQNSRQQAWSGSGFRRGPDSGPQPSLPQLRMLPSGEMEVIFSTGPLFSRADPRDGEVQQLSAPAFSSPSPPPPPGPAQPQARAPDGGARWATYLELRPRGPSPAASAQFECVEVALEERAAPARPRTVPKRQIELRPRPQSPAPRPRLLQRTGSLDESLGRLQAAAGLVQTALARKLGAAPASANLGLQARPEPPTRETAGCTQVVLEEARPPPARALDSSARTRALRPWPSLRERAIRRDKPAPGTEPLGPVSSSIFLQSEEKIQESHHQEPKARFPRETPDGALRGARGPAREPRAPGEVPGRPARPRSPSPPWRAPNGAEQGPPCPSSHDLRPWDPTGWRGSGPRLPEASSTWGSHNPTTVEDTADRRSPSPPTLPQWAQGVARGRSPSPETPAPWEAPRPAAENAAGRLSCPSPPALLPWEALDHPAGTLHPSPQEPWGPEARGSSAASTREAMNGVAQESAPPTPPAPGTPERTAAIPGRTSPGRGPPGAAEGPDPARRHPVGALDADARPEALSSGAAASGRPRTAIPRPRDVRKMVKTTYAPSFPAGGPGPRLPAAPDPCAEEGKAPELQAPAHYTSVLLKDFLPVVPHPYECPEPPDAAAPDAPQPNGLVRRRAENSTAKPFARTEIRLPGAPAAGPRPGGARARAPRGENRGAEAPSPLPDGEGARASPQPPPVAPAGARPPRPGSPRAHPDASPGTEPKLETPVAAPEPPAAAQAPLPREPPASAGGTAPPQPRAASAPPTDRSAPGAFLGMRRPAGAAHPGKVLVDPESGRYYFVEAPRPPRLRLLFDPESGQYVEVLLPPSSPGPPRHAYAPLALGPGLYPPAYGFVPGLSLPPSPGPPGLGSPQLSWASEAGPLDAVYYLPGGTPSPAPPLLLCPPPSSSGPSQPRRGAAVPL